MLARRIIPCLDVKNGQVVKGIKFKNHEVVGDILALAQKYRAAGADELVFYDITASVEGRSVDKSWISRIAEHLDIPFCVAGGIRSVEDARTILHAGADKVSVNSPALDRPDLVSELSKAFGAQCVVVGIDSTKIENEYRVYKYTGSESTSTQAGQKTLDWIAKVQDLGAGEIVLNCMNSDGTRSGYDLEQLIAARKICRIPLVASGGAGCVADFEHVFREAKVDGALAAGIFHRGEIEIQDLKNELIQMGVNIRP